MPQWQQILSAVTGIMFLVVLLSIALFISDPTNFQIFIFRTILALAAGAFATIISGFIHITIKWQKFVLRAGAGLAVFALIYMVNPPKLLNDYTHSRGFIPPETINYSSDNSTVLVVPPDGTVLSLLSSGLLLDLQNQRDKLNATVTTTLSIEIINNPINPAESVVNHIRGALYLSKNSSASITISVGGRIAQYDYPIGNKKEMFFDGDIYQLDDFFRQLTTPVTWSGQDQHSVQYQIILSIKVSRRSKSDIAFVAIDSLDAAIRFERRGP